MPATLAPVTTVQQEYCSLSDIQNRLSDEGVNLRVDDKPSVVDAVLQRAASKIDQYCRGRYDPTVLATSPWIKEACTTIACFYLASRRANPVPASLTADYEELLNPDGRHGDLRDIRSGALNIPEIAQRKPEIPVISQPRIRLDPFPRTVIEKNRGTGQASGYTQWQDRLDFLDYTI
jgi:phage gp36-like protein